MRISIKDLHHSGESCGKRISLRMMKTFENFDIVRNCDPTKIEIAKKKIIWILKKEKRMEPIRLCHDPFKQGIVAIRGTVKDNALRKFSEFGIIGNEGIHEDKEVLVGHAKGKARGLAEVVEDERRLYVVDQQLQACK